MQHRDMNPSLSGFRQFLIVLAQTPATAQPGQRTLHHPPPGQHLEAVAVRASAYHAQQPASSSPSPSHQPAGVGRISPDQLRSREPAQQLGQYQPGSIPVLDVGDVNHYREEQPGGIHYDVALAPRHLFARVIAARPPFSVVFTDWLSMMAALGVASLPSAPGPWGAVPPQPAPKCHRPAIYGSTTRPCPRRQVVGHQPPRYAATQDVQDAVYHLPQIYGARMAPG